MNGKPASPPLLVRFCDSFLQERGIRWVLALGVLVLLGSSLLLVTAKWEHATAVWKYVIFLGYTAALFGAGEWAYHRLGLRRTGLVLQGLTVLLVPILFLGLGWGLAEERDGFALAARLILGVATLVFSLVAGMRIFGHFLRGAQPTFLASYLILAAAGALLPLLPAGGRPWAALLLWAVFAAGTMKVNRHVFWLAEERRKPRIFGFFPIALLGGQFLTLYLLFAAAHIGLDWLGVGLVLVAVPVLAAGDALARVFQQRTGDLVQPLPWSLLAPLGMGLSLCAAGIGLAGTGLVPPHRPHALVFAAGIVAGLMAVVARRTGKSIFVWAMLLALTATYQFSPAFFIEVVKAMASRSAELVREDRLPYAFYGLTYLPLLTGWMAGSAWLGRRSDFFAKPMRHYCIGVACLLLAASLTHAKAIFPVGVAMTLVFAGQALLFRQRWLAWLAVLSWLLAAFGLAAFLDGVLAMDLPMGFRVACLTAASASLLVAGRWLDPWLDATSQKNADHELPMRPLEGAFIQFSSLALTLGLAAFWLIQVAFPPGGASGLTGAIIAVTLLVHSRRWRGTACNTVAVLPWVAVSWLALALLLLLVAPPREYLVQLHALELAELALPCSFFAAAGLLLWQTLAGPIAAPGKYVVVGHLMALRLVAALAIVGSLGLHELTPVGILCAMAAFLLVLVAEGISACRDRSEARALIALGLCGAAAAYLVWFRAIHLGSGLGMYVALGAAFLLWLGKEAADRHPRLTALSRPLGWTAFGMPLAAVALGIHHHFAYVRPAWLGANSLALLLAGGFYFWRGLEERRKHLTLLAALILNIALALLWRECLWSDPQFFMIPIGITVLALVQVFKAEIPERFHDPLRYAGALVILVSPVFHIVHSGSWLHMFTLMIASVGIVLVAIGLRVRALMYAGTAFLLADLIAMLVYGSRADANVLWIAGLALGTGVLALGAACERNREALLQRMRVVAAALTQWE
jgi:hypothetical protein